MGKQCLLFGGLLCTVVAVAVFWRSPQSCPNEKLTRMIELQKALRSYHLHWGTYPACSGLTVLTRPGRQGCPYLWSVPRDPWGRSYVYHSNGREYQLISYGADGKPGGCGENADMRLSAFQEDF